MTITTEQYTPVLNDEGYIEHNGQQFPATNTFHISYLSGLPSYGVPRPEQRWAIYTFNDEPVNLFWVGRCCSCDHTLWITDSDDFEIEDYLENEHLPGDGVRDEENDVTFSQCMYCENYGNSRTTKANGRRHLQEDSLHTLVEWPQDFLAHLRQQRETEVSPWAVIHPVEPVHGAFVFVKGDNAEHRFDRWDEGYIRLIGSDTIYDPEQVEVATPIVLGVKHPHVVGLPGSGIAGLRGKIIRQRNNQVVAVMDGRGRVTVGADHLAVLAPPLDPATEKPEDTVVRLRRESERTRVMMHARMVAEGTTRNWCATFDPILVSTGLDPRKPQRIFEGTMTFRWETDSATTEDDVRKTWHDHIPYNMIKVETVTITDPVSSRVLS